MEKRRPVVTTYLALEPVAEALVVTWARCRCGEVLFSDATRLPPADRQKPVLYFVCPRCWSRVAPESPASRLLRRER